MLTWHWSCVLIPPPPSLSVSLSLVLQYRRQSLAGRQFNEGFVVAWVLMLFSRRYYRAGEFSLLHCSATRCCASAD